MKKNLFFFLIGFCILSLVSIGSHACVDSNCEPRCDAGFSPGGRCCKEGVYPSDCDVMRENESCGKGRLKNYTKFRVVCYNSDLTAWRDPDYRHCPKCGENIGSRRRH